MPKGIKPPKTFCGKKGRSGRKIASEEIVNVVIKKNFNELMNKYLEDEMIFKKHKEGLNATRKENKIVDKNEDGSPIYEFVNVKDYSTRHKYLDTAYRLKDKYPNPANVNINLSVDDLMKLNLKRKYESVRDDNND